MKNEEKRQRRQVRRSRITRHILGRYLLSLIGLALGLILLVFFSWLVSSWITWQGNDPLYRILTWVRDYILLVVGILFFTGWLFITYFFVSRPLRYLDEVIDASEQLVNRPETPISLTDTLKSVQDELNTVREGALRNAALAKEAEQRKSDLVVYLAHDLKTPLTSVVGYLSLMRDESEISPELQKKYLSIALDKAERLEDLVNEFFEITRFSLSSISLSYSRINLTRLLEQLVFEFRPMLAEKGLDCVLEIAPDTMLRCDGDKLQRVFDNLLRNAVFYSFENSQIRITVTQEESALLICFENAGNTIPQEKLARIFEQFFRLDTARSSNSGGAGLGLAIAKELVELHHGRIEAHSADERIQFLVRLPLSVEKS